MEAKNAWFIDSGKTKTIKTTAMAAYDAVEMKMELRSMYSEKGNSGPKLCTRSSGVSVWSRSHMEQDMTYAEKVECDSSEHAED